MYNNLSLKVCTTNNRVFSYQVNLGFIVIKFFWIFYRTRVNLGKRENERKHSIFKKSLIEPYFGL